MINWAEIDSKIRRDDLKGAIEELLLHVKLLDARIDDLKREVRSSGARDALIAGTGRRR